MLSQTAACACRYHLIHFSGDPETALPETQISSIRDSEIRSLVYLVVYHIQ